MEGNTAWMLISTALVLFMVPGLALFYGGMVRSKNVLNIPLEAVPRFAYIQLGYFGITLLVTYYSMRYQARKKYG